MKTYSPIIRASHPNRLANGLSRLPAIEASARPRSEPAGSSRLLPLVVLLLSLTLPSLVQAQFVYVIENGAITITGYSGPSGALVIPATVDGLPVVAIGWLAFSENSSLTSVSIPDGVIAIEDGAFENCTSLANVVIPKSITNIGWMAFYGCTSLTAITVDASNPFYSSLDGVLFNQDQTTLIQCPEGKAGNYTIPNSVSSIETAAFENCAGLTNVTIPDSVTTIGWLAFSGCASLNSIMIPNSVISVGSLAFEDCVGLTSVVIPNSVASIEGVVFSGCTSLTHVTIPDSVTSVGWGAFFGCTSLTNVTIPDSVTSIGEYAFSDCGSLTNIIIPYSITGIGPGTFRDCDSLTDIVIPDSVKGLEDEAFYGCTSLTSITIPNGVTNIGTSAFESCTSLTSVEIPNNVTNIGWGAFYGCTSLTNVTIPESMTGIGVFVFYGCTSLHGVTIPDSVISIGRGAFGNCSGLTRVVIPNSVVSVEAGAFSDCASLTNVRIPGSVTSIGGGAFYGCTSLLAIEVDAENASYTSLDGVLFNPDQTILIQCPGGKVGNYTVPGSVTSIDGDAFRGSIHLTAITVEAGNSAYSSRDGVLFDHTQTNLIRCPGGRAGDYTIPDGVSSIEFSSFRGCTSLTSITCPPTLVSIGNSAFAECSDLTAIYFLGDAPVLRRSLGASYATIYYLPGTTGWGASFGSRPTVLWDPRIQTGDGSFGVQTNRFGFSITASSDLTIVVEASTSLNDPTWAPVGTNTLAGGSSYFSDPGWTSHPTRFYRLRSP